MKRVLSVLVLFVFFSFNAAGQYKRGHYYEKDGTKVSGLITFNFGGNAFTDKSDGDCTISFKPDKNGNKVKLTTNDICCFVIEEDSFAIIKDFRLNSFAVYPQDFAKVIESGRLNLYMYYSVVYSGGQFGPDSRTVTDWVIEKDGKFDKLTRKKFKELMPVYLNDYPELLGEVNSGKLGYRDSEEIIKLYNDHWRRM